jgi:hypothetical protein
MEELKTGSLQSGPLSVWGLMLIRASGCTTPGINKRAERATAGWAVDLNKVKFWRRE